MRRTLLFLLMLGRVVPAQADDVRARVIPERSFGYFVGDLIRARVEIRAPADMTLSRPSLPHPGPLTTAFELRSVDTEEADVSGGKLWSIGLTYQNFYVALDVRDLTVPGFALDLSGPNGTRPVDVPAWRVRVAPLREISPEQKESARDYLRPDIVPRRIDDRSAEHAALAFAGAAVLGLVGVARDRAWPPFHRRRARIFAALARRLAAEARRPPGDETFRDALRSLHRAVDASHGRNLLPGDLVEFLRARPEFAPLRPSFERFFAASDRAFFAEGGATADFGMAELARFAAALAARERAS